jgi:hypothetical protein
MIRSFLFLIAIVLISFSCNTKKVDNEGEKNWVSLFNGKDLNDWQIKIAGFKLGENFGNTFRVEDSIIKVRYDQYDSFNNKFGGLYYKNKFSNYRLKVEYRFVGETTPGAPEWGFRDSGVQYQCQAPGTMAIDQQFPVCLEYNLLGGNGKDDRPTGDICANGIYVMVKGKRNESYCTPATVKKTFHGDQWVVLEIDVNRGKVSHFVNGEEILTFEDPRYNADHELGKNFITEGVDRVKEGYISLQSNSHPIDFRRLEIIEY